MMGETVETVTVLETERLALRTWRSSDRPLFAAMNADPAVMEYFLKSLAPGESDAFADRIERHLAERGYGLYAIEVKADGRFIGFTGFQWTDFPADFTPCVEIGWRLERASWGRGYATEAASACLAYGFGTLGFERVYSFTTAGNERSQSVMRKIGLRKLGEFDHSKIPESHPQRRHVLYGLTKPEYFALHAGSSKSA